MLRCCCATQEFRVECYGMMLCSVMYVRVHMHVNVHVHVHVNMA